VSAEKKQGEKTMNTLEFLSQLNDAEKGWGLWINRENPQDHHVGHYSYETDHLPKSFVHVASLEELAHLRQKYLLSQNSSLFTEEALAQEWAQQFLSQWTPQR
jgi:hypothetical protein